MTETAFGRPGVYVREVPLAPSLPNISASTAVGALFGEASEGPIGPTYITSWRQFVGLFNVNDVRTPFERGVYQAFSSGAPALLVHRVTSASSVAARIPLSMQDLLPFAVEARSPGAWGNQLSVTFSPKDATNVGEGVVWSLRVTRSSGSEVFTDEYFPNLSLDQNSGRYFLNVLNDELGQGSRWIKAVAPPTEGVLDRASWLNVSAELMDAQGTVSISVASPDPTQDIGPIALEGGVTIRPQVADYTDAANRYESWDGALLLNCTDSGYSLELAAAMASTLPQIAYNHGNGGDSFAVLDTPQGVDPSGAMQIASQANRGVVGTYAAVYYPHVRVSNPSRRAVAGSTLMVPPGPGVVGTILAVDAASGPWTAPAGTSMGLAGSIPALGVGVERTLTPAELDELNSAQAPVNAIRSLPNTGVVIMGARTCNNSSIARYVSVRRALNMFKRTLEARCATALFQPLTGRLMANLTVNLQSYLQSVWEQNGLAGATTDEAYYVICNTTNNSAADLEQGRLNVDVGLALLVPAEFIVLRIGQFQGVTSVSSEE